MSISRHLTLGQSLLRLVLSFHPTRQFREKRRSVSIVPKAEKNQIIAVNRFTPLRRHKVELILIFLRRDLWIDFTARRRRIDFSGTAAGSRRVSRAILKLLCRSFGGRNARLRM
jgi:hypothetical protein